MLTLNVDWFQAFDRTVVAIYLTLNNLPSTEQQKKENVILIGTTQDQVSQSRSRRTTIIWKHS